MEEKFKEIVHSETLYEEELKAMDVSISDAEILTLAHRIIAKRKVRNDVMFDILKIIKENG